MTEIKNESFAPSCSADNERDHWAPSERSAWELLFPAASNRCGDCGRERERGRGRVTIRRGRGLPAGRRKSLKASRDKSNSNQRTNRYCHKPVASLFIEHIVQIVFYTYKHTNSIMTCMRRRRRHTKSSPGPAAEGRPLCISRVEGFLTGARREGEGLTVQVGYIFNATRSARAGFIPGPGPPRPLSNSQISSAYFSY